MMKMYRQGDVLLVENQKAVDGKAPIESTAPVVLAHGEVTGHTHRIENRAVMYRDDGFARALVVTDGGALLKHEEHPPIKVPAGRYDLPVQVEDMAEAVRQVAD